MRKLAFVAPWMLFTGHGVASALGVSPYLPLDLEPEMERQIERVLILADKPVLTRPIPAAVVLEALPKACHRDQMLCENVRRYLKRYMHNSGITHASVEGASASGSRRTVPNSYGMYTDSSYEVSAQAYLQVNEYILANAGAVAYDGDVVPVGSVLSVGFSRAQLDIGYRGHWLSPMTDSAMLLGTEAPTMPSVTLSNYTPLTRFGLHYELFLARMEESANIVFQDGFTRGKPDLMGLHASIEPASGWSLGVNRLMQYGGGERGGRGFKDAIKAFLRPTDFDNADPGPQQDRQFGNQVASFTSSFLYPGRTPFALYFEYAGEDTSSSRDYLLGNSALSAGIHFPHLFGNLELTYEVSEWQNAWYVHNVYLDGLTNDGRVIGHWGADERLFNDNVGAQTHMVQLGWEPPFGGLVDLRLRTVQNESYTGVPYERGYNGTLSYSRPWKGFRIGGEVYAGRDVFGESFERFGLFARYTPDDQGLVSSLVDGLSSAAEDHGAEVFVDVGVNANKVRVDLDDKVSGISVQNTELEIAPHFALGARRPVSDRSDLGARVEVDDINGSTLIGVRAIDYRYRFRSPFAVSGFIGAARYDLATPAYGVYIGTGVDWRDAVRNWDVSLDVRYAAKVARDDLLASDPQGGRPDSFYDIMSATLSLRRRF